VAEIPGIDAATASRDGQRPEPRSRVEAPRLGYREGAALFLAALHALAAAVYFRIAAIIDVPEEWTGQYLFLLCASLACALASSLVRKRAVVAILFGLLAFLLAVADYPEGAGTALTGVFACVIVLCAISGFRVSIPLVPALSFTSVLLFRLRPVRAWAAPPAVPAMADSLLLWAAVTVFGFLCLAAKGWEAESRRQRERVASLDRSIASLLAANLDFQNFALESGERSTIAERKRLSRDIHDIVGYTLINLRMMLEAAIDRAGTGNEALAELLSEARDQAQGGLSETRRVLRTFREMENAKAEGVASIYKIVTSFSQATGIEVEVSYGNMPRTLGPLNSVISHIVQEGMTNAIRHGGATRIQIGFWIVRDRLHMKIADNGSGAAEVKPGIGLVGMRERLEPIGGELVVQSSEYGFSLVAEMPLPEGLRGGGGE
jgi:signal transduction histidine kinase